MALSLCRELPVRQAAELLRCADKPLWRRLKHYVDQARELDDMSTVRTVGIDETSLRRGQHYITVVHDLEAKRLLFATEGRDHQTVVDFAEDLKAHGGDPAAVRHVCQDMSAAYTKGVGLALPDAAISYDRFHVIKLAMSAMDEVRRTEWREQPRAVERALGGADRKVLKGLMWGMRKNPQRWSARQIDAMHWLQHSTLKAARAWRLKMALREVYGPHVLSYLFPAWVTALGSAWKVAVMAELLASTDGVGAALAASRSQLDTATTLGWISAVVGCLLVVEYGFLEPLKREVERWREAPR